MFDYVQNGRNAAKLANMQPLEAQELGMYHTVVKYIMFAMLSSAPGNLLKSCKLLSIMTQGGVLMLQANLVKQLGKLLKVRCVEDITASKRVGEFLPCWPQTCVALGQGAFNEHSWI